MLIPPDELRHLAYGPRGGEAPGGTGLAIVAVAADGDVGAVIERAKEVLMAVVPIGPGDWSLDAARRTLPEWFVTACGPEDSAEEAGRWSKWWRGLDAAAKAQAERHARWAVDEWLFWLDPEERQWYWWDAVVHDVNSAHIFVEVTGWPTPVGALEWLLQAAGARSTLVIDG